MSEETKWVKLEVGNDWGAIFYVYPGERLDGNLMNTQDNQLKLFEGQEVRVRFPNLDVETLLLVAQTSMISLSGQGYCEVEQKRFGVNVSAYGVTVFIPIEHVEVELGAFRRRARR